MSATHDDYINMRLLVDVAEHTHDAVALTKLREYIEALEKVEEVRGNVQSRLPIPPLRIRDALPAISALRGGIRFYDPTQDFSAEAERLAKRRQAVIELFRTVNGIQWGNEVNGITTQHLNEIDVALVDAKEALEP